MQFMTFIRIGTPTRSPRRERKPPYISQNDLRSNVEQLYSVVWLWNAQTVVRQHVFEQSSPIAAQTDNGAKVNGGGVYYAEAP